MLIYLIVLKLFVVLRFQHFRPKTSASIGVFGEIVNNTTINPVGTIIFLLIRKSSFSIMVMKWCNKSNDAVILRDKFLSGELSWHATSGEIMDLFPHWKGTYNQNSFRAALARLKKVALKLQQEMGRLIVVSFVMLRFFLCCRSLVQQRTMLLFLPFADLLCTLYGVFVTTGTCTVFF
jgi:hypothetical protein